MQQRILSNEAELCWDEDGPLPSLSALWKDNQQSILDILRKSPEEKDGVLSEGQTVNWNQSLVFADKSLRDIILRLVLRGPAAGGVAATAAAIAKRQKKNSHGKNKGVPSEVNRVHQVPIPQNLGIVGTEVLINNSHTYQKPGQENSCLSPTTYPAFEILDNKPISGADGGLSQTASTTTLVQVINYFCRPLPLHAQMVARKIKATEASRASFLTSGKIPALSKCSHRVVFLPNSNSMCHRILLDEGVLSMDSVSVREVHLDLIPMESDLLSMEMPYVLKECYVDGVPSASVSAVAHAILKLQDVCGTIPHLYGMGPLGEAVISQITSMADRSNEHVISERNDILPTEDKISEFFDSDPSNLLHDGDLHEINSLIVIDRKVDLVTPLLTPLTYEGLLDEIMGIESGHILVEESLIQPGDSISEQKDEVESKTLHGVSPTTSSRQVHIALNGFDALFAEVRSQHFEKFGSFLQDQAKALKASHSNFTNKDVNLTQIHEFVKNIPKFTKNLQSLTLHIHLAEIIKKNTEKVSFQELWHTERNILEGESCYEALEDLTNDETVNVYRYLRLLCLQSLTSGGLKAAKFEAIRRDVIQTFGYEYLFTLSKLEKLGALKRREGSYFDSGSSFATLRKSLSLIHSEVDNVDYDDISYVSSGYAPLSVKLVQHVTSSGWKGREDILKELPGRIVQVQQSAPQEPGQNHTGTSLSSRLNDPTNALRTNAKPVLVVFFVGGVSLMEIAAMRLLTKMASFPYEIVCCTTNVVNGYSFLASLE